MVERGYIITRQRYIHGSKFKFMFVHILNFVNKRVLKLLKMTLKRKISLEKEYSGVYVATWCGFNFAVHAAVRHSSPLENKQGHC